MFCLCQYSLIFLSAVPILLFIARVSILYVYVTVQGLKPSYFIWYLIGQVGISLQRTEKWALVLYPPLQVSSNVLPLSI